MKTKNILSSVSMAIIGGVVSVFVYTGFFDNSEVALKEASEQRPQHLVSLPEGMDFTTFNFVEAADNAVEAVVHVKTESVRETYNPLLEFFYGERYNQAQPVVGFGSGVIISEDGYIVTNNHVIENSQNIYVTLNNKEEYEAKLVGTDPSTDIALLKIQKEGLQYIPWGDSDNLRVGEWVLAVGNPFNLTSTVTAGIVSAKGKNLGIIKEKNRMESFIQTDAAVNRGNSGGALVNIKGELVGINTAIISPSGGYAGISFAVPVSIVQKIVKDLIEFGVVQRAVLGVSIRDLTAELAKEKDIDKLEGVYVEAVSENGAAKDAGIDEGDVILSVEGEKVNTPAELQEMISRYRPNDEVKVKVKKSNGKVKLYDIVLRNLQGKTEYVSIGAFETILGARFEPLPSEEKRKLGLKYGVKITEIKPGKLMAEGVREGFIITQINNKPIKNVDDINEVIKNVDGGVYIQGIYPNGVIAYYAFGLD